MKNLFRILHVLLVVTLGVASPGDVSAQSTGRSGEVSADDASTTHRAEAPGAKENDENDEDFPISLLLAGLLGGAIMDLLRVPKWARTQVDGRGPNPMSDDAFWISIGLGMLLGMAAFWIFAPTTLAQALAFGFSAPTLLSKGVDAATGQPAPDPASLASDAPLTRRLKRWISL